MSTPSGSGGAGTSEGATSSNMGGGPWEQLVASLLAQHTALLHKLAAAAPLTCPPDSLTTTSHPNTRSPALSLGHYARRNWRNRRNRQRKKLRRLYNSGGQPHLPAPHSGRKGWRGAWQGGGGQQRTTQNTTPPSASATTTTHVRRTLRSVISVRETHAVAEAQQEKNSRLKEAFGISEFFVEGSSLDPNRRAKEELARAAAEKARGAEKTEGGEAGKKYGWVHTPSPSPEPSSKKEKKEKKKKKKRSRDRSSSPESRKKHKSKKNKRSRQMSSQVPVTRARPSPDNQGSTG